MNRYTLLLLTFMNTLGAYNYNNLDHVVFATRTQPEQRLKVIITPSERNYSQPTPDAQYFESYQQIDVSKIENIPRETLKALSDPVNRLQPGYANFITAFHEKIHGIHWFRKWLRSVPGFEPRQSLLQFIDQEAAHINATRIAHDQAEAKRQPYSHIHKDFTQQYTYAQKTHNQMVINRYQKRIEALNTTIKQDDKQYDYSKIVAKYPESSDPESKVFNNCYGTALDQQLHEELCQTRTTVLHLQAVHPTNYHIQMLSPVIFHVTAQAKQEQNISMAFDLADTAHDLTDIMIYGIELLEKATYATGRGVVKATKTVLSPQHWKDMGVGTVKLGRSLINQLVEQNKLDHAYVSGDKNKFNIAIDLYYQHNQPLVNATREHAKITLDRLREMSWDELLEHSIEIGAILVLDTLALNAAGYIASSSGRAVMGELAEIMQTSNPFAQECVAEIAGIGKVVLGEGAETANTINSIKKNPVLTKQETKAMQQMSTTITKNGIIKNIEKVLQNAIKKHEIHIFSDSHIKDGIMDLGKNRNDIMSKLENVISSLDYQGMLKEKLNQIHITINGCKAEIKVFVQDGNVLSVDAFKGQSTRIMGNHIKLS